MPTSASTDTHDAKLAEAIAVAVKAMEQIGPRMFHSSLAPRTVDEFMSGETASVVITHDLGSWWVKSDTRHGSDDYQDLDEAKVAAAKLVVDSWETWNEDVAASLGVDTGEWDVSVGFGQIVLKSKTDEREIIGIPETGTWSLYDGDDLAGEERDLKRALGQELHSIHHASRI